MFPDWFGVLFIGGMVLLWILSMIGKVYSWFDHSHVGNESNLRPDAKILKVDNKVVGAKNDKKIQTVVIFDDGFQYETYKTDRENGLLSYKIGVSESTSKEIIRKAVEAHDKACGVKTRSAATPVTPPRQPAPEENVRKQRKQQEQQRRNPPSTTRTAPAGTGAKPVQEEFLNVYMQTLSKPLGDEREAWNWIMDQIISFKSRGLEPQLLLELERNAITMLTASYRQDFDRFLKVAGDMTPIVLACERLLEEGKGQAAKDVAEPYLRYLLSHPELYANGQVCVQSREEAILCRLEGISIDGPRAKDNYTMFFVMYCRILDNILPHQKEDIDNRNREKERCLGYASALSPCNATVWEALARTCISGDESKYHAYISKALRYSLREGEPYGLGTVYANLAMHYTHKDPGLARALCAVCRTYGGEPLAAELVLSRMNVQETGDPKAAVRAAGIQVGYSTIVQDIRKYSK